jgi:hypothetical protein
MPLDVDQPDSPPGAEEPGAAENGNAEPAEYEHIFDEAMKRIATLSEEWARALREFRGDGPEAP